MRLEDILDALDALNPLFVIVDSIQTVYSVDAGAIPGTISQLKFCSNELITWVKSRDSILIMTAHVRKEGTIAGPKTIIFIHGWTFDSFDTGYALCTYKFRSNDCRNLHVKTGFE